MNGDDLKNKVCVFFMLGLFASKSLFAAADVPEGWTTSVELGAIAMSGNTTGSSVSGKIDAREELDDWSNHFVISGYFKEDEIPDGDGESVRVRSAQQYSVSAKAALRTDDKDKKVFVLATHADDKFGVFASYSAVSLGCSSRLYESARQKLDVDIGPGYFTGVRANGDQASGFIAHGSAALEWKIGSAAVFTQMLSVERGTANIRSTAEAALLTKISDTMQMKAAVSARADTGVSDEKKSSDARTSLSLVYSF